MFGCDFGDRTRLLPVMNRMLAPTQLYHNCLVTVVGIEPTPSGSKPDSLCLLALTEIVWSCEPDLNRRKVGLQSTALSHSAIATKFGVVYGT